MMLRSMYSLQGYTVQGTDDQVGTVYEFYFDDAAWTVRYLVVDTGGWFSGRRVLLSPAAIVRTDWEAQTVHVKLTRTQVENAPDIDTDRPISRQRELEYVRYYNWPVYWGMSPAGAGAYPAATSALALEQAQTPADAPPGDPHLRRTREVIGYYIRARDEDIGHIDDFIVDDATWTIRYMVVDTRNWLPGKKVLVSPAWVEDVDWIETWVVLQLSKTQVEHSPPYDPDSLIDRAYEGRLYDHYGQSTYWQNDQQE